MRGTRRGVGLCFWLAIWGAGGLASPPALAQGLVPEAAAEAASGGTMAEGVQAGFADWVQGFVPRARAAGISDATLAQALRGLRYNADVIDKDRNQSEFVRPIWEYLDRAVSDTRIGNGQDALRLHGRLLDRIEARYGVEREVVVAVWGLESSYGQNRGDIPVIEALATLAYDGRRGPFFEAQLIDALRIVQSGDVGAGDVRLGAFRGSWAGAMGHTQFIPSSYQAFAVDFDGDGRRDIWSDDPADALASTAAYLARSGWQTGRPWGVEVALPAGFDYGLTGERPVAEWQALGVRTAQGQALPDHGVGSILLPAGARGAAFLIFGNFRAIERYNAADAYVIAIGHLADRLRGGGPIRAAWPREDRVLSFAERQEMQERLGRAGYDTGGVDGKIGPKTVAAVRAFQRSVGMVADGYPSLELLGRLR
ncbi:lytic murein transglycosylase [Gemmobacter aquarius]|uniref:Lytic murein transglycosylase n=1 Tax=Paragemmobacter aquarius TaxID=2169400 RepID=A0A2S0UQQ9_9RHOB|nr:lytic murein transglycosylase [Gemmobacter aquarius]AWB50156.1 lytic murein transglycosylase [Gemmobacter aquarius]